jgi:cytochrome c-type biogenesis protein CcmE
MTPKKKRRLAFAAALLAAGGIGAWALTWALGENAMYFKSPSDVAARTVAPGVAFRLGGLVGDKSVRQGTGAEIHFAVTDGKGTVPVEFHGVLPALFREGQGVVAVGALNAQGTFMATEVLAKHDEKYMPPEVVDALKKSGRWQDGAAKPGYSQ